MRWINKISHRMRSLLRKRSAEAELDQEMRFHLERQIAANISSGMSAEEARCAALREFGGVEQRKEECRDARGVNFIETLVQDLRYGLRTLRKTPVFTAIAILTLALGIGANTAIFSVVYAILLRPLPYGHPAQLVSVFDARPAEGINNNGISYLNFKEVREQNNVFTEMAGFAMHDLTLTGRGEPLEVRTLVVTPEFLALLEAKPLAGRTFTHDDGVEGAAPMVILSENLWRNRLGADPQIVGNTLSLDKRAFTVIGIMPAQFRFPLQGESSEEIWIPLAQDPLFGGWMNRRGGHWMRVLGRLKPNVSEAQAQAELATMSARLAKEDPADYEGWTIRIAPLQAMIVGDVRSPLLVLLGAVGLVLLIACANIANLLLTRATSRTREIALRMALGAGRKRVIRQLLTESALLGLLGGVAGISLAYWGVQGLSSFLPKDLPQVHAIRVDGWVLGFALVLSISASFIFGLAPAFFATGTNLQASLKEGGRSGEGGGRRRARNILATCEIALAMVLLVAAGLLMRSFAALTSVNPGFISEHVVRAVVSLPQFEYSTKRQWTAFSDELLTRIQAQPGLQDSAVGAPLPLGSGFINLGFDIAGSAPLAPGSLRSADYGAISPDYCRVLGIPLLRGRFFRKEDGISAPRVAIISEALARVYFPNQDPLGRHMIFGFPPDGNVEREIVGVVGDVRDKDLSQEPEPMMYVPYAQAPFWGAEVIVKSSLAPSSVAATIREQVRKIDKDLPVTDIATLPEILDASVAPQRFRTMLLGLFGALALALAAAGIFGVISYSVAWRTHEIGIRMALGASPGSVLQMILGESAKLVLLGLAFGIPVALGMGRFLSSLLFEIRPADPLTYASVAVVLALVALAASYIPARRAMRVDPITALRYE
ncbi:MAG: ADOP family duplicated permease [Candidatus Acidiferrales bacterium]